MVGVYDAMIKHAILALLLLLVCASASDAVKVRPEHATVAFKGIGHRYTVTKNTDTVIDITYEQDYLLAGGRFYFKNAAWGDTIDAILVMPDGQGGEIVLASWLEAWNVPPPNAEGISESDYIDSDVLGDFRAGMILRVTYHSTGTLINPQLAVNVGRYFKL